MCERETERETETGTLKEIYKRNGYGGKIETSIETQCTIVLEKVEETAERV